MDMSTLSPARCAALANPNHLTVALAAFILVGILVSYLPQHAKILQRRSSEGLSPWWVLLGGLSSIAAVCNILTLPASRDDIRCCKDISGGACAAALLGIFQIGLQWTCFMFIVLLFLIYFPANPEGDLSSSTASLTNSPPPKRRDAVIVGCTVLLSLLAVGIVSIALVAAYPHHTQSWADFLGTVAGILAMIQYLPQIYFTYCLRSVKSLSVITMIIQVPGAFLFAFSLWLRVGWEGWSTWLVYLVTGVLQAILLSLAIIYVLADRRAGNQGENESSPAEGSDGASDEDDRVQVNERSALLQNGPGSRKSVPKTSNKTQNTNGSVR